MRMFKRMLAMVLCVAMVVSAAMVCMPVGAEWSTDYEYTDDIGEYVGRIAAAQAGKTGEELGYSNLWYRDKWCAAFVWDCLKKAGVFETDKLKYTLIAYSEDFGFDNSMIVSADQAQNGDIVFIPNGQHIGIYYNGKIYDGNNCSTNPSRVGSDPAVNWANKAKYYRPKYVTYSSLSKTDYTEIVTDTTTGNSYAYYPYAVTWNQAKEKCESFGGHLVTVTSAEEQAVVAQLAAKAGKTVWIGATRGSENSYSWVTGENSGYKNWAENEPNNYGGIENCAAMYAGGTWNDLAPDSGSAKGFICEWEGYVTDASKLEGEFYIVSALNTNKAIDIYQQSKSNKAIAHLWDYHGGDSQIFKVSHVGDEIVMTNKNSGKTLDVKWGYKSSGTPIWQWDTNNNKSQRFLPEYVGDGYFMLKNALGHYLDAKGGYSDNGTALQVYSKNDTAAQKWRFIYVDQSQSRGCDHTWENETEAAHPHRQLKKCSKCGVSEYTTDGSYISTCSECNPACSHSWKTYTETSHPHRQYKLCAKCGEKEYTNNGSYNSSCSECNPSCSHTWGYSCENAHPHRDYKICQKCGEKEYITNGKYDSSCAKCNPTCNHAWSTGNDSAHPHNEYRVCTKCGEKSYTGKTGYSSSCSTCTYTPSWGSWSDWSTASVSESSTRQVETKTQYVYYHYYLTYDDNHVGTYPINMSTANENFKNFANAHVKAESYHEYYSDSQLTLCNGRLIYLVNGQSVGWDKYVNKCSEDTGSFDGNANFLYYKGTRTLYRYRDYK